MRISFFKPLWKNVGNKPPPCSVLISADYPAKPDMPEQKPAQRVLGFDYGSKRIGIAVGQTATRTATALTSVYCKTNKPDWSTIRELIREWQPDAIVVGRPSHDNGDPHSLWPAIDAFCANIQQRWSLPVHFVDEYLSSFEAQQLSAAGVNKKDRDIDSMAAKILVENWLRQ
jgi:putative Holliday junction resolvase